jgi:hypothetical protein
MWVVISQLRDALVEFMSELTEEEEEEESELLGSEGLPMRSTSFMIGGQAESMSSMKDQTGLFKHSSQVTQSQPFVLGQALQTQPTKTSQFLGR